jgi:hypothetical protein
MPWYSDLQGRKTELGRCLGQGGEGAVYAVPVRPRIAAKIYARTPDPLARRKLEAMVQLGTEPLAACAAWPEDLLTDDRTGNVVGFLMARVEDHEPVHTLYSPVNRQVAFPEATWAFLIRAASNVAAAFAAVHADRHVIGDVNQANVVVSPQARVRLIDCDSFQITHLGRTYPCRVGVSLFTPPELQGRRFDGVVRTADHDGFGLAVMLFQLLFMGRHPFAGCRPDRALRVEDAIREGTFAFGSEAAREGWGVPPHALTMDDLSAGVAALFERAFGREAAAGGPRPTAAEWVEALGQLESMAVTCAANARHVKVTERCPWCRIESEGGPEFFRFEATRASGKAPDERAREILDFYDKAKSGTHYEVLGVNRDSTAIEIKQAYFRLARRFHPDTLGVAHQDLLQEATAVFVALGSAFQVLRDARSRAAYDERLDRKPQMRAAGTGNPMRAGAQQKIAIEAIRQAEGLLEQERFWDAIQLLQVHEPYLQGKERNAARVLMARAYAKNPNWLRRAEQLLQEVVRDDPRNVNAFLCLGRIYRECGMRARARTHYRKVLELDPTNREALSEIDRDDGEGGPPLVAA